MSKFVKKVRSLAVVSATSAVFFAGLNYYNGNARFFDEFIMPATHMLDPEKAHQLAVTACHFNLVPKPTYPDTQTLETKLAGLNLKNPIGIAAGFDKHAEGVSGLHKIGFGFVEIGSVTPDAQPGNDKPRVFRLVEDEAIINRYGFNSDGHQIVMERVRKLKSSNFEGILGVNLGKNKTSENPVDDYVKGVNVFGPLCNYLVINVSSPNTPGLRNMQHKDQLYSLLKAVIKARDFLPNRIPVLLKLAPDLTEKELKELIDVLKKKECAVDGLIVSNTTVDRDLNLKSDNAQESGGLSGKPLNKKSTEMIRDVYKLTKGQIPIVGAGGVTNGQDAFQKILSGASALQIYTSFVYHGPPIVSTIKKELDALLKENGYKNVAEAVGKGVK